MAAKTRTSFATCSLCDAICGIAVEHDGDRIVSIKGDVDDPFSKGHVCPKVIGLKHMHEDPDRVRRPLKRVGRDFVDVSWDEALDECGDRLARVQREHGNNAVALYVGNPTAHSYSAAMYVPLLMRALASKNVFSATSMDSLPRILSAQWLYGSPLLIPVADLDRTSLLVCLGANPAITNGSMMTAPNAKQRIKAIRERGGRVVVIDPRRNETAQLADEHHFIRPASDAYFLASLVHVVFDEGLARPASWFDNVDRVRDAVAPFAPEETAERTGVAAGVVRKLARDFANARGAALYARIGPATQESGVVNTWLVDVVHALTGNLDREGGVLFPQSPVPVAELAQKLGIDGARDRWRSRVRGLPEFNGELPIATLAEEIDTPGNGQVRALITLAGNIALSAPNSARLRKAIASLDVMVSIDLYVNETTRHAHFILPPTFGLENDHFPLLFHGLAVRNTAHYSPAVLPKPRDAREDWEIMAALAARLVGARAPRGTRTLAKASIENAAHALQPKRALDALLRIGPYRLSRKQLEDAPHGLDLGPLKSRMPGALHTKYKRVDLAPHVLIDQLKRIGAARPRGESLALIGRRDLRSNNSFMHNVENLVRGERRCTLLMHPDDAHARSITDGARVRVTSRTGSVDVEVQVSDTIMRGVVSLPHGWGHDEEGARLSIARKNPGVNINFLTDDMKLDPISGCVALNGVEVTVERIA